MFRTHPWGLQSILLRRALPPRASWVPTQWWVLWSLAYFAHAALKPSAELLQAEPCQLRDHLRLGALRSHKGELADQFPGTGGRARLS